MKRIFRGAHTFGVVFINLNVLFWLGLPAFLAYILLLGNVTISFYNAYQFPLVTIPGWSPNGNELEWNLPHWAPFVGKD